MTEQTDLESLDGRGASRRGLLKCMAWAGTGLVWSVVGGVPREVGLGGAAMAAPVADFTFVQISDSHIGFKGEANPTPGTTLQEALDHIAKLPRKPAMLVHTGDVTHLSKPEEFDTADQILKGSKHDIHFVPGEHDVIGDDGKQFFARFAKGATEGGWYSFDQGGVHFVALVNVLSFKPGTGGNLGEAQLAWLEKDLKGHTASTPIVVLAHMPLWPIYPQWGWSTDDAAQALGHVRRFGSVTVLNGHIHQVVQKVEGNVSFRTAMSTAFPQPPAGEGKGPGPMPIAADKLRSVLGIRDIEVKPAAAPAVQDQTLA
ncbi:MAG TPA: metallophosphoesterase [Stellaceae bacterium]|jgi:3',5'-cyclic AMP phosphodiesterase CpdA|nr:metallophosphoesterase [Stellaceae bacterium]